MVRWPERIPSRGCTDLRERRPKRFWPITDGTLTWRSARPRVPWPIFNVTLSGLDSTPSYLKWHELHLSVHWANRTLTSEGTLTFELTDRRHTDPYLMVHWPGCRYIWLRVHWPTWRDIDLWAMVHWPKNTSSWVYTELTINRKRAIFWKWD